MKAKTSNKELFLKALVLIVSLTWFIQLNISSSQYYVDKLTMFTNQSNIAIMLVYGYLFIKGIFGGDIHTHKIRIVKYVFTCSIALTFLTFGLFLTPAIYITKADINPFSSRSLCAHFICPILTLINYIIFDRKNYHLSNKTFLFSLIFPLAYYAFFLFMGQFQIFTFVYSDVVYYYPYFFMDPTVVGWFNGGSRSSALGVIPLAIIMVFVYSILSLVLLKIKNKT